MPIRSEETTRGMRKALIVAASIWRGDAPGLDVSVFLDRDAYESGREIAFGFSVDLLRDGQCVRTQEVEPDWLDGPNDPCPQSSGDAWFKGVKEADVAAPEVVDHWTLRIRGDGEMALRDWNRSQYWDGEATVPLAAALKNCVSPADFAQP